MHNEWKSTLNEYIQRRNGTEALQASHSLLSFVADPTYASKMQERLWLLRDWYNERNSVPVRSETRAKLIRSAFDERGAFVDLELAVQLTYDKKSVRYTEERKERERITLMKNGTRWVIVRIEPIVPEKGVAAFRMYGHSHTGQIPDFIGANAGKPTPFLNRDMLTGLYGSIRRVKYNRELAVMYANRWWDGANPEFIRFEVDCSNYVSQCLFAGGAPMNYTGRRESGWWYKGRYKNQELWSYSWAVANSLQLYLGMGGKSHLRATAVGSPRELTLGDVICYDWDGDNRYEHSTVVTAIDADGMPLVNAHTTDSKHRYWDYRDSYAWTPNTQYRLFHISDEI